MSDSKLTPKYDYLLCEELKEATGAVTPSDVADHWQRYKVLAAGEGRQEIDPAGGYQVMPMPCQVGDIIIVQKHAEADTPPELKNKGQFLISAARVMAVEEADA